MRDIIELAAHHVEQCLLQRSIHQQMVDDIECGYYSPIGSLGTPESVSKEAMENIRELNDLILHDLGLYGRHLSDILSLRAARRAGI